MRAITTRARALLAALLCLCPLAAAWSQPTATSPATVCLLRSPASQAYFTAQGGDRERLLHPWRDTLARLGHAPCETDADALERAGAPKVLVLASTVALSAREREAIERFARRGGGLIATWASGSRDHDGGWLGYGWLRETFGVEVLGETAAASEERMLLPLGGLPLTLSLAPGRRIFLGRGFEPLLRARFNEAGAPAPSTGGTPLATTAARYGLWHRHAHQGVDALAALTYLDHGGSRRVWLGAAESSWLADPAAIDRLIGKAIAWASRQPDAALAPWPHPHRAAMLVEMDTEDGFPNALVFDEALRRHGIPGTFYCLTSEAAKFPQIVRELASRHEIAYHADVHVGFKDLPEPQQAERIARMRAQLAPLLPEGTRPGGFRAPLESYDAITEAQLRRQGLRHHAADPASTDDLLPFLSRAGGPTSTEPPLVVLPRTLLDDINFVQMGIAGEGVRHELMLALADVERFGGFGLLSVHTQHYARGGELERGIEAFLGALSTRRDRLWSARAEDIERWWRARSTLSMRVVETSAEAMTVELQSSGALPVAGAQLLVMAPSAGHAIVRVEAPGAPAATAQRLDADRWRIGLGPISRQPVRYTLRFSVAR